MNNNIKLCLGTAQFSQKYGINNTSKIIDNNEALKMINYAWSHGITAFDTANGYGKSEELIGSSFDRLNINNPNVITKITFGEMINLQGYAKNQVKKSLQKLSIDKMYGLMLHDEKELSKYSYKELVVLKQSGLVKNIGVSFYNFENAVRAIESFDLDFVQVPYNLFDRRLLDNDLIQIAYKNNVKIHVRSVFLQGLIFMEPELLSKKMDFPLDVIYKLRNLSKYYKLSIDFLAIKFVVDTLGIDYLVIGADNISQLKNSTHNFKLANQFHDVVLIKDLAELSSTLEEKYISPNCW